MFHMISVINVHFIHMHLDFLQGAIIGIDDEDDSTFTITVDHKTFHFQGN